MVAWWHVDGGMVDGGMVEGKEKKKAVCGGERRGRDTARVTGHNRCTDTVLYLHCKSAACVGQVSSCQGPCICAPGGGESAGDCRTGTWAMLWCY